MVFGGGAFSDRAAAMVSVEANRIAGGIVIAVIVLLVFVLPIVMPIHNAISSAISGAVSGGDGMCAPLGCGTPPWQLTSGPACKQRQGDVRLAGANCYRGIGGEYTPCGEAFTAARKIDPHVSYCGGGWSEMRDQIRSNVQKLGEEAMKQSAY